MHGNVFEWCDVFYDKDAPLRLTRGGFWFDLPEACKAARCFASQPHDQYRNIGFRLARVPAGQQTVKAASGW